MQKNTLDSSKIKILVCCHKPCGLPKNDIFLPIQVGASISDIDLGIQRDDQVNGEPCDNISSKNKSYCELTAMYWAWKNIKKLYPNLEYIGLNHYRRYFSFDKKLYFDDAIIKNESCIKDYKINKQKLENILADDELIIAKRHFYPYPIYIEYSLGHISDDMKVLKNIVHELYPDYDAAFYDVIMRQNGLSHYNMFIMSWEKFDSYCSWLFTVLFECEKKIDISRYNPVQARIWGYMAERLFNVWLYKNFRKDLCLLNIYKYDNNGFSLNVIKRFVYKVIFGISTKIICPKSRIQKESAVDLENKYLKMIQKK